MNCVSSSKVIAAAAALLLATATYAASAIHKGSLTVSSPVQVNGKQLPPGQYTVTWEGEGPETSLRILNGKKEIASAPCTVASLDKKATQDESEIKDNPAGGRNLTALRFSGQKYQLTIADNSGQGDAKSASSVK